jgi:surface antigen
VTGCGPATPVAQAPVRAAAAPPAQVDAVAALPPVVVAAAKPPVAHRVRAAARTRPAPRPLPVATRKPVAAPAPVRHVVAAAPAPKPVATTAAPQPAPKPVARTTTSGDAYPYANASGTQSDPWGFTERQCVSYVAWRLSRAGHTINNRTQGWGNALHWDETARARGIRVTTTPSVGAVAQWNAGESSAYYASGSTTANGRFAAGSYGHVGYVTAVYRDGSVQISQYNGSGTRSYSSMHVRAPRYLVF